MSCFALGKAPVHEGGTTCYDSHYRAWLRQPDLPRIRWTPRVAKCYSLSGRDYSILPSIATDFYVGDHTQKLHQHTTVRV